MDFPNLIGKFIDFKVGMQLALYNDETLLQVTEFQWEGGF